ncbi:MAG: reverse transcriptase-like protein [Myxococcales bacterium]|nr:reverse transcriptase-like protein [Myxococcales bacterium]
MPWRRASFKDQKVWVEVDPAGTPRAAGGRVPIRYNPRPGAKVYQAGAGRVTVEAGAPVETLDDGTPAPPPTEGEAKPKAASSRGSGFGKAGTRTEAQAAMAQDAAQALIAKLRDAGAVLCFTDGACKGNPGPAGSGAVVEPPEGPVRERSLSLGRATNNIAELTAIEMALDLLDELSVPPAAAVAIFTDSKYSDGVLAKGWKAKANTELVERVKTRLKARRGTRLHWIAGHVGVDGNERADALANAGVAESTKR